MTLAGVCGLLLVAISAIAYAQPRDVQCKKTETQAECHARLKCKADEDVEACQRRLLRCTPGEQLEECQKRAAAAQQGNQGGRDDRDPDQTRDQRRDDYSDDEGDDRGRRDRRDDRDTDAADRDRRRRDRGGGGGGDGGRRRRDGGGGGDGFAANKTFGLGLELGEPTGLTGKYFLSDTNALDFGVGYIYRHYYYDDGLHIYGDYLWHPALLASADSFELPFYIGVGLRFWDFEYCERDLCGDGTAIGVRVPLGISFDFNTAPVDIFIQLIPVLDFVDGDYYDRFDNDRVHFGIDASFGIRFWFK